MYRTNVGWKREKYTIGNLIARFSKRVLDDLEEADLLLMKVPSSNGKEEEIQRRQAVRLVEKTAKDLGRVTRGRLARWTPKDRSHEKLLLMLVKGE